MGVRRGEPARPRSRRRGRVAVGLVAVGLVAAATACEQDTDVPVRCQALGVQTQAIRSEAVPAEAFPGGVATLRIQPRLVTGVPLPDSARLLSVDLLFPVPPEFEYARAEVERGGTLLGRASVEGDHVRVRYAGGSGSPDGLTLPAVQIGGYIRYTTNSPEIVWRAPDRIDVMVELHGELGMDTCTPVDPSFRLNATPLSARPPDTSPGTWYGTWPPGTSIGTRPAPAPTSTIVVGPATSLVRDDPPSTPAPTTAPPTATSMTTTTRPAPPPTTTVPTTHPPHDH